MDMIGMLEVIGYHSSTLARYWNIDVNMVRFCEINFVNARVPEVQLVGYLHCGGKLLLALTR